MGLLFKFLLAIFAVISVSACQTTGLSGPQADGVKKLVNQFCVINWSRSPGVTFSTDYNLSDINVYSIKEGKNGWGRADVATTGMRFDFYYNAILNEVECGSDSWRKKNIQPDPFAG